MDELKITLSPEADQNPKETVECLISAASAIFSKTENDFEEIKNTKWYKRLWKLITFSKDNEKKLADGVSSVAKLQEIIMKALLLLADKSADISDFLCKHDEEIVRLSQNQASLAKNQSAISDEIARLKTGAKKTISLYNIEGEKRKIFMTAFCSVVDILNSELDYCVDYYNQIYDALDCTDAQSSIRLNSVNDTLNTEEQLLLYRVIIEYVFLATNSFVCKAEILDYLAVSPTDIEATKAYITVQVKRGGRENLLLKYKSKYSVNGYTLVDDDDIDWIIDKSDDFEDNKVFADEENNSDYSGLFNLIRSKIGDVFLEEKQKAKIQSQIKRQKEYHEKYIPQVIPKTIVAVADLVMVQVIFTTSGIHIHRSLWNDCVYAKYADINTSASTIDHKKNILHLLKADKTEFFAFESSASFFDCSKFLELIDEIKALNTSATDCPIAIADMSEEIKLAYGKALVCFSNLTKCQLVEAIRIIHDLKISDDTLHQLCKYIDTSTYQELLLNLKGMLPYPSEENACYSLIQDMAVLIQYSNGRCCDITGEEDKIIGTAVETLGIDSNIKRELIPVAQINYRILQKDITKKEMDKLGQRLKDTAAQVGISLAVVSSTSALLMNHLWLWFIPSFGYLVGIASATLSLVLRKKADKDKMDSEYERIYKILEDSYSNLYRRLSKNCKTVQGTSLIHSLKMSAERTNKNIKEFLDNIQ